MAIIINMDKWKSKNRSKYLLQYHIIFVCKFRKKLLSKQVSIDIKQLSYDICNRRGVTIKHMETDKDHIHYMIELHPSISISKAVNLLKSYTTYHIWKKHNNVLSKQIWGKNMFWSGGYFACSIGSVSEKTLRKYIENQG